MKRIDEFPSYSATKDGQIYSHLSNRNLSQSLNTKGYMKVNIRKDGKDYTRDVHRLILLTYRPDHAPQDNRADHMDGDKLNNHASNLQWVSDADNVAKEQAGIFIMCNPNGDEVPVFNMAEFCRDFDLNDSHMNAVYHGKRRSHKGWTRVR